MNEKLRRIVFEKNIKQRDLAEAAGVSQAFMSGILKGYKQPSLAVMKRIADYVGVTIDELVRDET